MKCVLMGQKGGVAVVDTAPPELKQGDILVEMKVCGLCGTDIEKIQGEYTASPPVIGHEAVGMVADLGPAVDDLKVGDRVFPHHHVPCYECYFCRCGRETMCPHYRVGNLDPGGFSEFFRVPSWNLRQGGVLTIPNGVSFEEASLIEPTACCIRGLSWCQVSEGDTVLVVGAGPVGLIHLKLLTRLGAKVFVSEVSGERIKFAERMGASDVFDAASEDIGARAKEVTQGRGVDLAVVASGSPRAVIQALKAVRKGGKISLFGVPAKGSILDYDLSDIYNSEVSIIPSYAAAESDTKAALKMIAEDKPGLSSLITHRFRLSEFDKALDTARKQKCIKVVIVP